MKKGNLHYYRNKEEILFACHQYSLDRLLQMLEEGIADGSFAPHDVTLRSFGLLGAVNWIPRWFDPEGPATSGEIADRFADYLIAGLR